MDDINTVKVKDKFYGFYQRNKRHAKNSLWLNVASIVSTLAALGTSVVFTRFGSKADYGYYLYLLSILSLALILTLPGIKIVVLREASRGNEEMFKRGNTLQLLLSVLTGFLIMLGGVIIENTGDVTTGQILILGGALFPTAINLTVWQSYFKAVDKFDWMGINIIITEILRFVFVSLAIIANSSTLVILAVYLIVSAILNIIPTIQAWYMAKPSPVEPGWVKQGAMLTLLDISSVLFGRLDIFLIGTLLTVSDVAIYGLVMKISDVFTKFLKSSVESIQPQIFKNDSLNLGKFKYAFILSAVFPLLLVPIIHIPVLILYGNDYAIVSDYSRVYLFVIPLFFFNNIVTNFILKHKLDKEVNVVKAIGIVYTITAYGILIPTIGLWGGVIASMGYYILQGALSYYMLKRRQLV